VDHQAARHQLDIDPGMEPMGEPMGRIKGLRAAAIQHQLDRAEKAAAAYSPI
jgi:hypothetical protein